MKSKNLNCPDCNKKQRRKDILLGKILLGKCKKCGRKHKISDYQRPNANCPLFDVCNYVDDCGDDDWEHCATLVSFKKNFKIKGE